MLLALTLLRVLLEKTITGNARTLEGSSVSSTSHAFTAWVRRFLFGALIVSALMLVILAGITSANNAYNGADSGFSMIFELLLIVPVGFAAIGLWIKTNDQFFFGLSAGCACLFPVLLVLTWFPELRNPNSPVRHVKGPVWTAVIIRIGILAASLFMSFRSKRASSAEPGKFTFGVIVALPFGVAALDACLMHLSSFGLLRD